MDPLRRLLLLGLLTSVILTEPGSLRAAMISTDLAGHANRDTAAAVLAAGQLVQRLAAALQAQEQKTEPAAVARRSATLPAADRHTPAVCPAQVGCVHAILTPHEFRPPPPVHQ